MRADPDGVRLVPVHARTRWQWWAALVLACGCGPASGSSDCDETVVTLFEASPGETIEQLRALDDGALIVLRPVRDVQDDDAPVHQRIVYVEACGAEPKELATRVAEVSLPPQAELPWLLTFDDDAREHGTWVFDPRGAQPMQRVSATPMHTSAWSESGVVVSRDSASGEPEVVAIAVSERLEVVETVLLSQAGLGAARAPGLQRQLVAVGTDGELVVIDLATRAIEHVRGEVRSASTLDPDARVVVAATMAPLFEPSIFVIDRERDVETLLGRPEWSSMQTGEAGGAIWAFASPGATETQVFLAPEGRELWWPGQWSAAPFASAPDGTRIFTSGGDVYRLEPEAELPELVANGEMKPTFADDTFYLRDGSTSPDADGSSTAFRLRRGGALGPFVDLLDREVHGVARVDGSSWAYLADAGASGFGALRVRDLVTGDDELVANEVASIDERLEIPEHGDLLFVAKGDRELTYRVRLARL